eukprot:TRINITY_DN14619_c0_g1_i1.p1 TRINITY_DN14619_c0_g1~~TRINITY_DN14619_c0_g1_i1.p1  ORF type:complete len:676 (+),score=113.40 TRINITY_DN14619_c0_g1_i1:99-2126(+)
MIRRTIWLLAGPRSWGGIKRAPVLDEVDIGKTKEQKNAKRQEQQDLLKDAMKEGNKLERDKNTAEEVKQRKKKKKTARKMRLREVPKQLTQEEMQQKTMEYAGNLLGQVPKQWLQESSVLSEATGLEPPVMLDDVTQKALEDRERNTPLLDSGAKDMTEFLTALDNRVKTLEKNALSIRQRHGNTKTTLPSSDAYLKVITKSPTGMEALIWLDELEMTKPEWLTPLHYERAFLLAVEPTAPACERDILILWAKARGKNMVTTEIWSHMMLQLGLSSLRPVAFEFLYEALKQQYGVKDVPQDVCYAMFSNCKAANDPKRAIRIFLELTTGGTRIGLLSYLEIVSLLTRNVDMSNDQEVLDYMLQTLQEEAGRVISTEGLAGIPRIFFARALTGCSPEAAVRLWKFMVAHGIRVTYEDYLNFVQVMLSGKRLHEVQLIYRYLAANHPEYLWMEESRIPLSILRVYVMNPGSFSDAMYLFSEHFGPESGGNPSVTAYELMLAHCKDPLLTHTLFQEMLARGLQLETRTYNRIFEAMGGSIKGLTTKLKFNYPASPLDDEVPKQLQEMQGQYEPVPQRPPAVAGTADPYTTVPQLGRPANALSADYDGNGEFAPPVTAYENRARPHLAMEAQLPPYMTKLNRTISDTELEQHLSTKRRTRASQKVGIESASQANDGEGE